jgi:colanic acid biosynthesis glycosyl transferase WcaI
MRVAFSPVELRKIVQHLLEAAAVGAVTMRILALGINYWPEEFGIAPFSTGRCEYLASRGHEVTVCTGFPYYPKWQVRDGYRGRWTTTEVRNGVTILRSWLYVPRRVTSLRRILHEGSFIASSMLRTFGQRKPDVLFVISPPLGLSVSAVMLSRVWRIPFVLHVADLQPDAAVDLGMLQQSKLVRLLYFLESFAYRNAALISTLTPAMRNRIVAKGIAPDKVVLFRDWTDPSLFDVPLHQGGDAFKVSHGLGDRFLVVHAGNMGVKQGLEVVLDAAQRSRAVHDLTYLLVGDGAVRPALQARAAAMKLENLKFLPPQPGKVFNDLLAATDIALITQQKVVADIVFPSKTITMLAAARPIVASLSPGSEVARVISAAQGGTVVAPEDPDALVEAVMAMRRDEHAKLALGRNGRMYARRCWDRERILPELEAHLLRVAPNQGLLHVSRWRQKREDYSQMGQHAPRHN